MRHDNAGKVNKYFHDVAFIRGEKMVNVPILGLLGYNCRTPCSSKLGSTSSVYIHKANIFQSNVGAQIRKYINQKFQIDWCGGYFRTKYMLTTNSAPIKVSQHFTFQINK